MPGEQLVGPGRVAVDALPELALLEDDGEGLVLHVHGEHAAVHHRFTDHAAHLDDHLGYLELVLVEVPDDHLAVGSAGVECLFDGDEQVDSALVRVAVLLAGAGLLPEVDVPRLGAADDLGLEGEDHGGLRLVGLVATIGEGEVALIVLEVPALLRPEFEMAVTASDEAVGPAPGNGVDGRLIDF